jgi:hypothetical protein
LVSQDFRSQAHDIRLSIARVQRLARSLTSIADQERLAQYAHLLETEAARLEREAGRVDAADFSKERR